MERIEREHKCGPSGPQGLGNTGLVHRRSINNIRNKQNKQHMKKHFSFAVTKSQLHSRTVCQRRCLIEHKHMLCFISHQNKIK
uniref:Uncharacterized protein n=1 Tax=Paramormyrops kingsleyae TaxID=1676925 RepID=A0A3B3RFG1_9TELE